MLKDLFMLFKLLLNTLKQVQTSVLNLTNQQHKNLHPLSDLYIKVQFWNPKVLSLCFQHSHKTCLL